MNDDLIVAIVTENGPQSIPDLMQFKGVSYRRASNVTDPRLRYVNGKWELKAI